MPRLRSVYLPPLAVCRSSELSVFHHALGKARCYGGDLGEVLCASPGLLDTMKCVVIKNLANDEVIQSRGSCSTSGGKRNRDRVGTRALRTHPCSGTDLLCGLCKSLTLSEPPDL